MEANKDDWYCPCGAFIGRLTVYRGQQVMVMGVIHATAVHGSCKFCNRPVHWTCKNGIILSTDGHTD